jgi:spore coat polysaccharide biosynthesis protein SpsF (cytidylyltransferase family)
MYKQKINIFIQARMGSKRLPGKVLKIIQEKALIEILIDRLKKSKRFNDIIVLTSTSQTDNVLVDFLKSKSIKYFRGDEDDVLDRYYSAAQKYLCDYIVRITGDCPLIDPNLLDKVIDFAINSKSDYCSNTFNESFPDGQDIEVFRKSVLFNAWEKSLLLSEREHVTPFIIKNTDIKGGSLYNANAYEADHDYSAVRMTVDTLADFKAIKILINKLGIDKSWEVYTNYILNNPKNFSNQKIIRNSGYLESLKND